MGYGRNLELLVAKNGDKKGGFSGWVSMKEQVTLVRHDTVFVFAPRGPVNGGWCYDRYAGELLIRIAVSANLTQRPRHLAGNIWCITTFFQI